MRFAKQPCLVAVSAKLNGHMIGNALSEFAVIVSEHAMRVRILPGHVTQSRRGAYRIVGESMGEIDPSRSQSVEVRRSDIRMVAVTCTIGVMLVAHDP
jgi:hypothetical protein